MTMWRGARRRLATVKSDPYWWEDAGYPANLEKVELPNEVDVLVIGAGLTGLSAARTLAAAGKSVLVVDAMQPGEGASSRNGGMMGGGHRLSYETMCDQFGRETAISLLRVAHLDSGEFVKSLIHSENIQCDFVECGRFRGLWSNAEYRHAANDLERCCRDTDPALLEVDLAHD